MGEKINEKEEQRKTTGYTANHSIKHVIDEL